MPVTRRIELQVPPAELALRRAAWRPPPQKHARGWAKLFAEHVLQADTGADFDFLLDGAANPEPEIN